MRITPGSIQYSQKSLRAGDTKAHKSRRSLRKTARSGFIDVQLRLGRIYIRRW